MRWLVQRLELGSSGLTDNTAPSPSFTRPDYFKAALPVPESTYRLYIDESGDHTYRFLQDDARRFLGITGVLIRRGTYDGAVLQELERLKKKHLKYDPDIPPILVRSEVVKRKGTFGRFRDSSLREAWSADILRFFRGLQCSIFTVVIDKRSHYARYGSASHDPYNYSLDVLLNRVRGLLGLENATADVMAESRGKNEDLSLKRAYGALWLRGSTYASAQGFQAAYTNSELMVRKKDYNVAGLQVADLLAYGLKQDVLERHHEPSGRISTFTRELNASVAPRINQYGRYMLR